MHDTSDSSKTIVNVSVVGYCGPFSCRVGKSSLIHRFMHWNNYTEDHLSVISNSDFNGSIISATQWIYWGLRKIQWYSRTYVLRIIEHCNFIDDHVFCPVTKVPYVERCFTTLMHIESPKLAYVCKEQLGNELKYSREFLEAGEIKINAFVVVSDRTLTGDAASYQEQFLRQAFLHLCKFKLPFVLATSKSDITISSDNDAFLSQLIKDNKKSLNKNKFCQIDTSARLGINVDDVFISAVLLASSNSTDLIGKHVKYCAPSVSLNRIKPNRSNNNFSRISSLYMDKPNINPEENLESQNFRNPSSFAEDFVYDLPSDEAPDSENRDSPEYESQYSFKQSPHQTITLQNLLDYERFNYKSLSTSAFTKLLRPSRLIGKQFASPISMAHCQLSSQRSHPLSQRQTKNCILIPKIVYSNRKALLDSAPRLSSDPGGVLPPLLLLFLLGPRASALRMLLHSECCLDRFKFSEDCFFRIWIFDAVDKFQTDISPSKWQPQHSLQQSSALHSAFSALPTHLQSLENYSAPETEPSFKSTASNNQNALNQLRLTIWVGDSNDFDSYSKLNSQEVSPPPNGHQIEAIVWYSSISSCEAHLKYEDDSLSSLVGAFSFANHFGVPLFRLRNSSASQFLSHLLFFLAMAGRFRSVDQSLATEGGGGVRGLIPPSIQFYNLTAVLPLLKTISKIAIPHSFTGDESLFSTFEDAEREMSHRDSPTVAIGIDLENSSKSQSTWKSPLVALVSVSQAIHILSQKCIQTTPLVFPASISIVFRFVVLHFLTPYWPLVGRKVTSEMENLISASREYLHSRGSSKTLDQCHPNASSEGNLKTSSDSLESVDEEQRNFIILLAGLSGSMVSEIDSAATGAACGRQLVNGLAAQNGYLIWHPKATWKPRCHPSDVCYSSNSSDFLKPSLAFLHVHLDSENELDLYSQVLFTKMTGWLTNYSPDVDSFLVEGRCSRGDSCDICHRQTSERFSPPRTDSISTCQSKSLSPPMFFTSGFESRTCRVIRPIRPQARVSRCSSTGSLNVSSMVTASNSSLEKPPSRRSSRSFSSTPPTSFARGGATDSGVVLLSQISHTNKPSSDPAYPSSFFAPVKFSQTNPLVHSHMNACLENGEVGSRVPLLKGLTSDPSTAHHEDSYTTESLSELSEYIASDYLHLEEGQSKNTMEPGLSNGFIDSDVHHTHSFSLHCPSSFYMHHHIRHIEEPIVADCCSSDLFKNRAEELANHGSVCVSLCSSNYLLCPPAESSAICENKLSITPQCPCNGCILTPSAHSCHANLDCFSGANLHTTTSLRSPIVAKRCLNLRKLSNARISGADYDASSIMSPPQVLDWRVPSPEDIRTADGKTDVVDSLKNNSNSGWKAIFRRRTSFLRISSRRRCKSKPAS